MTHYSKSYRVNGVLAVSRALGDLAFQQYISAEPDVFEVYKMEKLAYHLSKHDYEQHS